MEKIRKIKPYYCPFCKKNLRGDKIPKKDQIAFGATHFGQEIAQYDIVQDRTVGFVCPYCSRYWGRK